MKQEYPPWPDDDDIGEEAVEMLWQCFLALWKAIGLHGYLALHPEEVANIAVIALFKTEALDAAAACTAKLLSRR